METPNILHIFRKNQGLYLYFAGLLEIDCSVYMCVVFVVSGAQPTSGEIASQLMQNPEVLAALQDRLGSMVGQPSGYIQR